jgi:hypothetical protein
MPAPPRCPPSASHATRSSCSKTRSRSRGCTRRGTRSSSSIPTTPCSTCWPTCWPATRTRGSTSARVRHAGRAGRQRVSGQLRRDGYFQITVTPKPGQTPVAWRRSCRRDRKIARDGVTPRELARSLNSRRASFLDQLASVLGKADQLASYDYNAGTPDYVQQDLARYEKVTAADVQRVATTYLNQPKGGAHGGARREASAHGLRRCQVSHLLRGLVRRGDRRGGKRRRRADGVLGAAGGHRPLLPSPPRPPHQRRW